MLPVRLIVAYALIAALVAIGWAVYLHYTRESRLYRRAERGYRRARHNALKATPEVVPKRTGCDRSHTG